MFTTSRTWVAGTVVIGLLIATACWFLLIGPKRAEAAEMRELTLAAEDNNALLVSRLEQLEQEFIDLPAKEAELAAVRAAMPGDLALPSLIRLVDGYAADTRVTLMSLAPGAPVVPVAATQPPAAAAEEGTATVPVEAVPAGPVTVEVPVTTTVVGDYFDVKAFLERLQTGTRAHLVTGLSLAAEQPAPAAGGKPTTQAGHVTMTITGSVFALRDEAPGGAASVLPSTAAPAAVAS